MRRVMVWVDSPKLLVCRSAAIAAAGVSLERHGFSAATAVSQADVAKTSTLVHSLQQAIDRLLAMLSGEKDEAPRQAIERKKQDLDLKLQQQKKVLKELHGYVTRLMAKLKDMQKLIQQTVEKQGQKAAIKLKMRYNEMYRSYYGRDHYQIAA